MRGSGGEGGASRGGSDSSAGADENNEVAFDRSEEKERGEMW